MSFGDKIVIMDDNPCNDGKIYKVLLIIGFHVLVYFNYQQRFELRLLNIKKRQIVKLPKPKRDNEAQ